MANVAFLLADGYEDSEMDHPYQAVKRARHNAVIIGLKNGEQLKGKKGRSYYVAEMGIADANPLDFDAVIIPGGLAPERLRNDVNILQFVQKLHEQRKLIAAICHGPQVFVSADIIRGKKVTCYAGMQDEVKDAGAEYVDREVVVDHHLITSRMPEDEPAFIREILARL